MPTKSCYTCAYRTLNPQQCPLIGYNYADDRNQVCPYHTTELPKCDICGQITPNSMFTQKSDGSWIHICKNCQSKSGTCGGCSKSSTCDFETNPSPIPKAIQKRIQQGNQIMVTTVKNDARINETCAKNCECFDHETRTCCRENNTCGKYEDVF